MYDLIFTRMAKPWLHPDVIFNLTDTKRKSYKIVKILEDFVMKVTIKMYKRENTFNLLVFI